MNGSQNDLDLHIVLHNPEIPYNTGNVIRLCANMGFELHLIEPLGFELTESKLRRAALDYTDLTILQNHKTLKDYISVYPDRRIFAASAKCRRTYTDPDYSNGDSFLFGSVSMGLPDSVFDMIPEENQILIPMKPSNRCLNLANSVGIVGYEAWRQMDFWGCGPPRNG